MTLEQLQALLASAAADKLSELDEDGAKALAQELKDAYNALKGEVTTAEQLEGLSEIVAAITAADARVAELAAEVVPELTPEELAAKLAELDEQANATAAAEGEGDDDGDTETEEERKAREEAEAQAAKEADEAAADEAKAAAKPAKPKLPSLQALANVSGKETAADGSSDKRIVASSGLPGYKNGERLSVDEFGEAVMELHPTLAVLNEEDLPRDRRGRVTDRMGKKHYLASVPIHERAGVVHQGEQDDGTSLLDKATADFYRARDTKLAEAKRIIASGGDCGIMAEPDYSIKVVGQGGTCFIDDVPTVVGKRPMSYYPWLMIDQSNGATGLGSDPYDLTTGQGMGYVTPEQDEAGYGDPDIADGDPGAVPDDGAPFKDALHIDCPPDPRTCNIEAVYQSLSFGEFQARSHPEYVNAWTTYMNVFFDIKRDNHGLAAFNTEANAQSHMLTESVTNISALVALKDMFNRLLAKERSARHDPSMSLNVIGPEWLGGFLAKDAMLHTMVGLREGMSVTPAAALALASTDGVRMSTYCTEAGPTASGSVRMVLPPIGSGDVPDWPTKFRLLAYADGAVFKKTNGELRLGLRETLHRTNDFGMFQETFEVLCFRGPVYVIDVTLCANGATGAPVTITC